MKPAVMTIRGLVACLGLAALGACGPYYKTVYHYDPPRTPVIGQCVATCGQTREICFGNLMQRQASCQERVAFRYEECVRDARSRGKDPSKECTHSYCSEPDRADCEPPYAECYAGCGARVVAEQVCVWGCDQAQ